MVSAFETRCRDTWSDASTRQRQLQLHAQTQRAAAAGAVRPALQTPVATAMVPVILGGLIKGSSPGPSLRGVIVPPTPDLTHSVPVATSGSHKATGPSYDERQGARADRSGDGSNRQA